MRGEGTTEDIGERLPVKAVVAGLALLYALALAAGLLDGVPPERKLPAEQRQAVAAPAPIPGLCFRGPGGEPVDFPAQQHCT